MTWFADLLARLGFRPRGAGDTPATSPAAGSEPSSTPPPRDAATPPPIPREDTPVTVRLPRALPSGMVSEHFSWGELGCSDGAPVPTSLRSNAIELVSYLEVIRADLGDRKMRVKCYRTPAWNDHVSGAERSQHLLARAADIRIDGVAPMVVHATILRLISRGTIKEGGVGLYLPRPALPPSEKLPHGRKARVVGWVHYDCRGTRARWTG